MKNWKRYTAIYVIGAIVSYGHIFREFYASEVHSCYTVNNEEKCSDHVFAHQVPHVDTWFFTLFWPYHWSEVAWRQP